MWCYLPVCINWINGSKKVVFFTYCNSHCQKKNNKTIFNKRYCVMTNYLFTGGFFYRFFFKVMYRVIYLCVCLIQSKKKLFVLIRQTSEQVSQVRDVKFNFSSSYWTTKTTLIKVICLSDFLMTLSNLASLGLVVPFVPNWYNF